MKISSYLTNYQYKFINDSVFGGIGLSALEVDLINTSIFQRLRHLRQLGLLSYVFPSAEHSRFTHSLGVLCIMGKITHHLKMNGDISEKDEIKLRIAALLHDIGHYPLSHLGETVYSFEKEPKLIKDPGPKGSLLSKICSKTKKHAHHEKLGKFIISNNNEIIQLLTEVEIDPEEIGSIVTGEIGTKNLVYSQLMHSSLDADRLDYLIRDSFQTGVRYGLVDLDYLIRLLKVNLIKVEQGEDVKEYKLIACNIKGQHVIEHYLMSRYFHYSQVIGHKTNQAFEALAKVLFYKLIKAKKFIFNSYDEILENVNKSNFLKFTDEQLIKSIEDYYLETEDEDFKIFYDHIKCRIRPKTLIEIKAIEEKNKKYITNLRYYNLKRLLERNPERLSEILEIPLEHIGHQEFEVIIETIPSFLTIDDLKKKDKDVIEEGLREAVRLVDTNDKVTYLALDSNSLINKLTDLKSMTLRVFFVEPPGNPKELEKKWKDALELLEKEIS